MNELKKSNVQLLKASSEHTSAFSPPSKATNRKTSSPQLSGTKTKESFEYTISSEKLTIPYFEFKKHDILMFDKINPAMGNDASEVEDANVSTDLMMNVHEDYEKEYQMRRSTTIMSAAADSNASFLTPTAESRLNEKRLALLLY